MLLLINNPSLRLILFCNPVKTFFLLADELIANGFIVLSCSGRRVKQKEIPNVALFSFKELAELSSQSLPSQKKSSLTSRGKEHSIKMSLIIKQTFSTVVQLYSCSVMYCFESVNLYRGLSVNRCTFLLLSISQPEKHDLSPKIVFGRTIKLFKMSKASC